MTITIVADVVNQGLSPAAGVVVRFWNGEPAAGGSQIGTDYTLSNLMPGAGAGQQARATWGAVPVSAYAVYVEVDPDDTIGESNESNNTLMSTLLVAADRKYLPLIIKH